VSTASVQDAPQVPDSSGYAPRDVLVMDIGDQLLVFRADPVQCVAAAQGRRRCRNEIEYDDDRREAH
jgi:hypothetical protein